MNIEAEYESNILNNQIKIILSFQDKQTWSQGIAKLLKKITLNET